MFYFFVNRRRTTQLDLECVAPKLRTEVLYRVLLLLFAAGQADDGIGAFLILGHQRLLIRGVVSSDLADRWVGDLGQRHCDGRLIGRIDNLYSSGIQRRLT